MVSRVPLPAVAVVACLAAPVAHAQAGSPRGDARPVAERRSPELEESLGASVNQLGLQNVLGVRWTRPLTHSQQPSLADAHLRAGLSHTLTPSYTRLCAWLELAPLSILDLRAGVEPGAYFGSFGNLMSFGAYGDDFSDTTRSTHTASAHAGAGNRFFVAPTLKGRVGTFVFASSASLEWWRSSAAGPLYYEPARDTLLSSHGDRLLTVNTGLACRRALRGGGELTYGLSHDLTEVFAAPANRSQRIGVVLARRLAPGRPSLPSRAVALRVVYYLQDPIRRGQLGAALGVSLASGR